MKLTLERTTLTLHHQFTISRGSRSTVDVVLCSLEHDGIVGYGEASPSSRYGESVESVEAFFAGLDFSRFESPLDLESIAAFINGRAAGNTAAKAGIDIALHDWIGKRMNLPLYQYWGLDKRKAPLTSFTIGIDAPEMIRRKTEEAGAYPILKVKLGGERDHEIIRTIRSVTQKPIRVDANEGWKKKEEALEKILWLEQEGVEFVEQPMPASDLAGTSWLRERVHLPLIADENCIRLTDVPHLQGAFDGINIKLMKCTGLREAARMVATARACGLKIMLGCMIESSVGISAAAQLSPLVDYCDLDGNLLITNDPFDGVRGVGGRLDLPDRPGIGVIRRSPW